MRILDELEAAGMAVEVTHRSNRRPVELDGLRPRRDVVRRLTAPILCGAPPTGIVDLSHPGVELPTIVSVVLPLMTGL